MFGISTLNPSQMRSFNVPHPELGNLTTVCKQDSWQNWVTEKAMILQYRNDHLSITQFDPVELPAFTVLTGINGSGKSHLLQAITGNRVALDDIHPTKIVRFDYQTFNLDNEPEVTAQGMYKERQSAWDFFTRGDQGNLKGHIIGQKNNLGADYPVLRDLCRTAGKSLWELGLADVGDEARYQKLQRYREQIEQHIRSHQQLKGNPKAWSILMMLKKLKHSGDEIGEEGFYREYEPHILKSEFLPTQLGKIFADYYSKYDANMYQDYKNREHGERNPVLSKEEFVATHGQKPWDVINQILQTFGGMPYQVNSPEGLDRDERYKLKLIHTQRPGVSPDFSELSSGERILMALVASIYKASADNHFPEALLLDEIDASLHPSMIRKLLDVVEEMFLKKGMRVLLVSHSPTTIALAPEESIYIMQPSGADRIQKATRSEALNVLTEGFATLDQGVRLLDQVARTKIAIITEGRNTNYISRALEIHGIADVEVVTGAESITSKGQLKTIFDFFAAIPHEKIVLIVWDCDANKYRQEAETNRTVPFVLGKNEQNAVCTAGIENNFAEGLFRDYTKRITDSLGNEIVQFDEKRKADFEEFVLQRRNKEDFVNFEPLIEKVKELQQRLML